MVKLQFAKLSWGQNTAYNTLLGVKVRFAMFLLGSKLGLRYFSWVQSTIFKAFSCSKLALQIFSWGQSTVCIVFQGVKLRLDHSSGSELLVHFRAQDVLYDLLSFFFPAKNPLGSKALEAVKMRLKTIKENHHTIFLALHLWDDAKGFHLFIFLHC